MPEIVEKLRANYSEAHMAQINLAGEPDSIRAAAVANAAVEIHWLDHRDAEVYFAGQQAEPNARAFMEMLRG